MSIFRKAFLCALAATALGVVTAHARDNFVTSPTVPYPPGCVSSNNQGIATPTFSRQTYNDSFITLADAGGGSAPNVGLQVFRRGCIEDGRSLLYLQFEHITVNRQIAFPRVFLETGGTRYPMRLTPEANTFGVNHSGLVVGLGTYTLLVDGPAEQSVTDTTPIITPEQYSGPVTLVIEDALDNQNTYTLPLPSWNESIKPQRYPLNGRLSGVWVSEGAARQGFVLAFNEIVDDAGAQASVFFSWYTYDADGNPLWLASSNFFTLNASAVELPLERLSNGEFLGPATPDGTPAGSATLTALSCEALTLDYDLAALGLGAGTLTLQRSFAAEVAGYACRDVQGRLDERFGN